MKNISFILFVLFSFYFISCSEGNNPISNEEANFIPVSECSVQGLEIEFVDSCSYDFVIGFLASYDSILIQETFLGSTFYLYADSGDHNYWQNYFVNDSTIQRIIVYNSSDSLILKIKLTGKKSTAEARQRFLNIKNLEIIKIEEYSNLVYIDVPEKSEMEWQALFEQYSFISHAYIVGVCTSS